MGELLSIAEFVGAIAESVIIMDEAKRHVLEKAAKVIEKEAKSAIGTYDYDWTQLAEATQETREREGFTPNEPGLRTGEMRDSISHQIVDDGNAAEIGSDDVHLLWFELGTEKGEPPRPVLEGAAVRKEDEVVEIIGDGLVSVMLESRASGTLTRLIDDTSK